jgi:hypothetical protein
METASCLCGGVAWEAEGPFDFASHCHCSRCRKTHGAAYATYVSARAATFRLRRGADLIARYESSPGNHRSFCERCGSVAPGAPAGESIFLPGGCFDDPGLAIRPRMHLFVASKAPWFEIRDGVARFDAYPPEIDAPALPDLSPALPERPGAPRGSCLCGAVAFRLEGPSIRAHHCHCSRCRKAHAAAFATNLFTAAGALRFEKGAERVRSYKLPEALRFTQDFCDTCGSILPRADRARGLAIVPMGALDDDPGMRPQRHIFVASKAAWDEIADDLPRFDAYPAQA